MTITIDLRWVDRINNWFNEHGEDIKRYLYIILLLLSPVSFIFGTSDFINWLGLMNFNPDISTILPLPLAVILSAAGLGGSVVLFYLGICYFIEFNNKHKWFKIMRERK